MVSFAFWERVGVQWGVLMVTDPIWPEMEQFLLSSYFQRGVTLELALPPIHFSPTLSLFLDFFLSNFFIVMLCLYVSNGSVWMPWYS